MTPEQLKEKLRMLEVRYDNDRKDIYKEYAYDNNPYKVNDMITDHVGTIKIEKIQVYISGGTSQCVYTGTQYNKDGKVSKKQDHATIYQENIINHLN